MRGKIIPSILLALATLFAGADARSTTMVRMSVAQLAHAAPLVVRARCVTNSTAWDHGEIWTFTSFAVEETWKGARNPNSNEYSRTGPSRESIRAGHFCAVVARLLRHRHRRRPGRSGRRQHRRCRRRHSRRLELRRGPSAHTFRRFLRSRAPAPQSLLQSLRRAARGPRGSRGFQLRLCRPMFQQRAAELRPPGVNTNFNIRIFSASP
jgi:hypothetical protein